MEQGRAPVDAGTPLTVLVLGVGGNVSQGIMKALALSELDVRLIGACISPYSAGLHVADRAYVSPYANDPGFVDWLHDLCASEDVDVILSGVEPVLEVLSEQRDELARRSGARTIVSDRATLRIGLDKLETARWLQRNGLNYARTADAADDAAVEALATEVGFPLIAKPRRGKGSQGIFRIEAEDLGWVTGRADYIVQELLGDDESEYTAGCLSDRERRVAGTMVMRRLLQEGTTVTALAGEFPEVRAEAERIAAALQPVGPSNIQLRVHEGRPTCFEINVRFSGTTPIRARLGFNDVEAAIRHHVLGEEIRLPVVKEGTAVRYWNEIYPEAKSIGTLDQGEGAPGDGMVEDVW